MLLQRDKTTSAPATATATITGICNKHRHQHREQQPQPRHQEARPHQHRWRSAAAAAPTTTTTATPALIGYRPLLLLLSLLLCSLLGQSAAIIDETISEHEGKPVVIPCPVNIELCGKLHSINWFKGDDRIAAVLFDDSNQTSVIAEYKDRAIVGQNLPFNLVIKELQISDEDIYFCDTTFFIPAEKCDNVNGYRVELNVLVPPTEVVILDEKGDRIVNGSSMGPMQERQMLKTSCVVRNTRPQPQVGWWRGSKRLTTHSPSYDEQDGLYTATLELSLQLSRDDLGHDIECRVESAALPEVVKNRFSLDLQVRPTSITINGVEHHTVQGSKVVLTCDVHGARPPVNLTWYNATDAIGPEENDVTEIRTKAFEKSDGTFHTQSELIFNATRFENDKSFRCDAENVVLQVNREKPFTASMTLEVLYPPVVKVSPLNLTVNTSDTVLLNCEYVANPASLTQVIWYRNTELVNVNDSERYEGGNSENVALVIRTASKEDIGNYSCQLSNSIGKGNSEQQIDLDVQFVPIVEVLMIPEGPVKESDESNVTLYCNVLEANPGVLTKVRWYANSTLLKELPDCEETREDLCHIDPSKLLLESVGRGFFYNYSCEGYNPAGWGPRSEDRELVVHYEPGPANLTSYPKVAIKKQSVQFSCNVEDPGYPETIRYRWLRGGRGPLQDIVSHDWMVEPVGLDSRTNYSCYAYNAGGKGAMATINLEVHAPPFFIRNLRPYTGVLHSIQNANLTCRIECVPRCEISWLKDGLPIDANDTRYFVKEKYMDASPATGDFESMLSVLHFNMSNWPNKKFDIEGDNANYTCISTGNTVGPGIKSSTYFSIEYAPDNTTVTAEAVDVEEDTTPKSVTCNARANPEPTYEWHFHNKSVIRGNTLIINTPMTRNDTGRYTCYAINKHGNSSAETFINVQFKPRCEIERREIDDQDTLICTAFGNPEEADFSWSIKAENETVEALGNGDSKTHKDKSFYVLNEDYAIARTYRCVANNTVGAGAICEIEVAVRPKKQLAWWQRWDKTTLIILIASILGLLLAVVIICCIIICICRQRRRQDKYQTDVSICANQSVLSYQPSVTQSPPPPQGVYAPQVGVAMPIHAEPSYAPTVAAATMANAGLIVPPTLNLLPTLKAQVAERNITSGTNQNPSAMPPPPTYAAINYNNNDTSYISIVVPSTRPVTGPPPPPPPPPLPQERVSTTAPPPTQTANRDPSSGGDGDFLGVESAAAKQAPKSPPRWPLRPGVMVHVSSDTKESLAVNRMTLRPLPATHSTAATATTTPSGGATANASSSRQLQFANTLTKQLSAHNLTMHSVNDSILSSASTATTTTTLATAPVTPTPSATSPARTQPHHATQHQHHHQASNEPTRLNFSLEAATLDRVRHNVGVGVLVGGGGGDRTPTGGCQTLPIRRRPPLQQQQPISTAKVNPNNQILTVDDTEQTLAMLLQMGNVRRGGDGGDGRVKDQPTPRGAVEEGALTTIMRSNNAVVSASSGCQLMSRNEADDGQQAASPPAGGRNEDVTAIITERSKGSGQATRLRRMESFLTGIFRRGKRRSGGDGGGGTDSTRDSQRSHVGLLAGVGWLHGARGLWRRGDAAAGPLTADVEKCPSSPFAAEHRLKGIRCSGSVTYKKTPVLKQRHTGGDGGATTNNNDETMSPLNATLASIVSAEDILIAPSATTAQASPNSPEPLPPSHASVTFLTPSSVKALSAVTTAATNSNPNNSNHNNNSSSCHLSSPAKMASSPKRGILKSSTPPPPRPPRPTRLPNVLSAMATPTPTGARVGPAVAAVGAQAAQLVQSVPPPLLHKRTVIVTPTRVERVQIHDKSSSLGDPLTEPGEYENLPFHGLQTAPNKFSTTPTNFNNNTNVVRVAPRPKGLNGTINQHQQQQQQQQQIHDIYDQQQQQLQYHQQHSQQQYSTMQYGRTTTAAAAAAAAAGPAGPHSATLMAGGGHGTGIGHHNRSLHNLQDVITMNGSAAALQQHASAAAAAAAAGGASHQITYNLNNCFPKSYTEYYHQQQQQQHHTAKYPTTTTMQAVAVAASSGNANGLPLSNPNTSASSSHLLNAIEHDYPTYAVVERPGPGHGPAHHHHHPHGPTKGPAPAPPPPSTNPFLAASNFKRYDTPESGLDAELYAAAGVGGLVGGVGHPVVGGALANLMVTGSMQRNKRKPLLDKADDKKFYSLKFNGGKSKALGGAAAAVAAANNGHKSAAPLGLNATMMAAAAGAGPGTLAGKCKRHHSFAGGSFGDIDSHGPFVQQQQQQQQPHIVAAAGGKAPLRFYDPPVYENLSGEAVQIHECDGGRGEAPERPATTVQLHAQPTVMAIAGGGGGGGGGGVVPHHHHPAAGQTGQKKKHQHRQHQQKDDFNLIEPERLSIYRSDSGISNSSYECVTPAAGLRAALSGSATPPPQHTAGLKAGKAGGGGHKAGSLAHSTVTANFSNSHKKATRGLATATPVYMNVDGQVVALDRSASPASTLVNSSYESTSSSQNDGTAATTATTTTDPTSLSSNASLYSSGTGTLIGSLGGKSAAAGGGAPRQQRHQQNRPPADLDTPEEYEQYQLGHQHAHSASSLSVASSVSASGSGVGIGGATARTKVCKKQQQQQTMASRNEHVKLPNPFLAVNPVALAAAAAAGAGGKKPRRQTISDPYTHIRYIADGAAHALALPPRAHGDGSGWPTCHQWAVDGAATTTCSGDGVRQQQAHHNCAKSANTQQQAAAAAATAAAIQSQWQISVQQGRQQQRQHCQHGLASGGSAGARQQQMLIPLQQQQQQQQQEPQPGPVRGLILQAATADDDKIRLPPMAVAGAANRDMFGSANVVEDNLRSRPLQQHHQQQQQQQYLQPGGEFWLRPMKLPLRKYHSFHFQPSQTVAGQSGNKLQQLRLQQQQQQQQQCPYALEGPLVFRPLQWDENHAFKPISPDVATVAPVAGGGSITQPAAGPGPAPTIAATTSHGGVELDSGDFTQLGRLTAANRRATQQVPRAYSSDVDSLVDGMEFEEIDDDEEEGGGVASRRDEEDKSEMSEELAEEITKITKFSSATAQALMMSLSTGCASTGLGQATAAAAARPTNLSNLTLNPAASLEALEALTKSNPELIYATKPGTRQNLHTQWTRTKADSGNHNTGSSSGGNNGRRLKCDAQPGLSTPRPAPPPKPPAATTTVTTAPPQTSQISAGAGIASASAAASTVQMSANQVNEMKYAPHVHHAPPRTPAVAPNASIDGRHHDDHADDDEEEDLGYSYCEEDECEADSLGHMPATLDSHGRASGANNAAVIRAAESPNVTVILPAHRNAEGQVKYVMARRYREVHI